MPGFFTRFANRLWRAERYTRGLASMLHECLEQIQERGEQDKELINIHSPLLPGEPANGPYLEVNFLRRAAIKKTPALRRLFATEDWRKHAKDYNVTLSLPQPRGRERDLFFVAAFERPWQELDFPDVRDGIIEGVAVAVHEAMEDCIKELLRQWARRSS